MTKKIKQRLIPIFLLIPLVLNAQTPDTLVVGYHITPPFVTTDHGSIHGPSVWLWEQVSKDINMPVKYVELPLDSLLSSLATGGVDVSLSPLTITRDRSGVIDFSSPYYIAYATILTKDLTTFEKTMEFIASFFSLNFFRALGALFFVLLFFGCLVWLFERKHNPEEFGNGYKGLWEGLWWSAVTMTTVGYGDKAPRSVGGRVIGLIWMFTAVIIISGFTAGIASSLTVNRMGSTGSSMQDFKDKKLGTIATSDTEAWLKSNFFNHRRTFSSLNEMIDALNQNQIDAVAYDRPLLQYIVSTDSLASFQVLNVEYNSQFYAMGMNQRLPEELKDKLNLSILEQIERMDWRVLLSEYNLE